jgi:thiamine monophosphate kinase
MSGCGSEVREQLVPLAEGAPIIQALTSGEEAELLCAGPPDIVRDAGLAVIGALREGGGVIVLDAQGGQRAKPVGGYQHFA